MPTIPTLHTPAHLGSFQLPHRVVMAPMTRSRAGEGRVPTPLMARYYRQRASAAWIVTEATQVSEQGIGYVDTPGIHTEAQVEGWRRVTAAVHEAGGRIFLQLWHVGRISHSDFQPGGALPVAPSAVRPEGELMVPGGGTKPYETPRALETEEIPGIVEDFRQGARRAGEAGFDGVEIHAANGYLVDQFLRDGTNRREDAYGGSVENRARLLLEVTEAAAAELTPERVGVRLSPLSSFNDMSDGDPEATFVHAASELSRLGIVYLHVVENVDSHPEGERLTPRLGEVFDGVLVANGHYDRERAERAVASGTADLVAFGRLFLANPDLPERLRLGAELNEPDPSTFYGGGEEGYVDYPTLEAVADAEG